MLNDFLKIKTYKDPPNTIEKYPKIITATTIKKTEMDPYVY
jgi:hypothetical protein